MTNDYPENYVSKLYGYNGCGFTSQKKINKKRKRRTAKEIDKKFVCNFEECGKLYGSEGALRMHKKLKHRTPTRNRSPYNETVIPLAPKTLMPSIYEGTQENILDWVFIPPFELLDIYQPNNTSLLSELPQENAPSPSSHNEYTMGSIFFSCIHHPLHNSAIFQISSLHIGKWSLVTSNQISLSLLLDTEKGCITYFIEEISLPLHSQQTSVTIKIEFPLHGCTWSTTKCPFSSQSSVDFQFQANPEYYKTFISRGHIFDLNYISWMPCSDVTGGANALGISQRAILSPPTCDQLVNILHQEVPPPNNLSIQSIINDDTELISLPRITHLFDESWKQGISSRM